MAVSTVSYTKTPQASDDVYDYTEDQYLLESSSTGSVLLDVMADDLGGSARKLYSIDNGDALTDLLTKDPNLCTAWEQTAEGNWIRINNGKIEFKLAEGVDLNSLAAGTTYSDTFKYAIQLGNGTISYATVALNFTGVNDAASLGSADVELAESDAALTTGGTLSITDLDEGETVFQTQTDTPGVHGKFSIDANGNWTYMANEAFDSLNVGDSVSDTFDVYSADGTKTTVKVTITGTNDAAVITGSSTAELTESDAAQSTSGDLNATDVDSPATFVVQTDVAGSNGYGKFSIDASGAWTYTMNNAHDEFVGGVDYTDSITVATDDGTEKVLTVTMHGTNDAAVITGSSTAELTESDAAQSTSGDLNATDVDSPATFVVQTDVAGSNGYGKFSIDANGQWTYTMDNAHNEFAAGQNYTDSITVKSVDDTEQVITVTITGTNDAAVLSSADVSKNETNAPLTFDGKLTITDIDSQESFVAQTNTQGQYGKFSIATDGTWTYAADSAYDNLNVGQSNSDSFQVSAADGTTTTVKVTINGTADGPLAPPPVYTGNDDPTNFDGAIGTSTGSATNGDDVLVGTSGNNNLNGQGGNDTIYGVGGGDNIIGGGGNDTIYGGSGNDSVNAGQDNDTVYGGSGNDILNGTGDNDVLYGGSGTDTIDGGDGNDNIYGGYGNDELTGGAGSDTFYFLHTNDTGDRITDFSQAQGDKIDLAALDSGTLGFTAGTTLSSHSVNFYYDANTDRTVVQVDTDGDVSDVELQIELTGNIDLVAEDFNL